ncbi:MULTISPECIES: hypothetical protein [Caballeronia]|uniref:Uncharacterized protein n=1 Tax=Caballeronia zhejiangensis TaxID=871203 RepID=A0A656QKS6_9BURK|nr:MULTISPECIES: hypothetical protein [Caballeronia]EKS67894.1 hypothetical protein BURK_022720 [Burkholderia sp. SJ98]KDR31776.1 hypothetical protein BG60_29105 [Caballeronia zhejiangensis]
MSGLDPFDSPTTDEVYSLVRSAMKPDRELDRELVVRVGREVLRNRNEFRREARYLCDVARKVAHESGLGFVVALEKLHSLLVADIGRTGDIARNHRREVGSMSWDE